MCATANLTPVLLAQAAARPRTPARAPRPAARAPRCRARMPGSGPASGAITASARRMRSVCAPARRRARTSPPRTASADAEPAVRSSTQMPAACETARSNAAGVGPPPPGRCRGRPSPRAPPRLPSRAPAASRGARSSASGCRAGRRRRGNARRPRNSPCRLGADDPPGRRGAPATRAAAPRAPGSAPDRRRARRRRRPRARAARARTETWSPAGIPTGGSARAAPSCAVRGLLQPSGGQLQEVAALLDRAAVDQILDLDRERGQAALPVLERDAHQVRRARVDRRRQHPPHAQPRSPSSDSAMPATTRQTIMPNVRK